MEHWECWEVFGDDQKSRIKQKARGSLKGNYGVVVGVMLLSSVVLGVCSGILQLVCSVVGTFSTAGSIALSEQPDWDLRLA